MKLLKSLIYYLFGTLSTRVAQFLFLRIYTSHLSAASLGTYDYYYAITVILFPVMYQAIGDGVLRLGAESRINNSQDSFYSSSLLYVALLSIIYILAGIILNTFFHVKYIMYIVIMLISQGLMHYWTSAARAKENNRAYATSEFLASLVTIAVNYVLIVHYNMQTEALFISSIAGSLSTVLIIEMQIHIFKLFNRKLFSKEILVKLLKYCLPFIFATTAWQLYLFCGKIIVPWVLDETQNGIYGIASRFTGVFSVITFVYAMAWQEELIRRADANDISSYYNDILSKLARLLFGAVFIILPATTLIFPFIIQGEFFQALPYALILYIETVISTITLHFSSVFVMAKDGKSNLLGTCISIIVTIIAIVILGKLFGLYGVVAGSIIGAAFRSFYCKKLASKHIKIEMPWRMIILGLAIYVLILFVLLNNQAILTQMLVMAAAIVFAIVINKDTIGEFKRILKKRANKS